MLVRCAITLHRSYTFFDASPLDVYGNAALVTRPRQLGWQPLTQRRCGTPRESEEEERQLFAIARRERYVCYIW